MAAVIRRPFWLRRIEDDWQHRSIVWLRGVRRVGKTTLARSLGDVEYFDCDLASVRGQFSDAEAALESLRGRRVVLDEIHRLEDPAQLLKNAADHFPDIKILATGSSTLAATSKFSDSLTGRKREVWLTPMVAADLELFGGELETRLWRGGLPPFYLGEASDADMSEWMQSYWARDVQELFAIQNRWSFIRLIELILASSGGAFEATRFAAQTELSRQSVNNYLDVLETTGVVSVIRPYSTRRTGEIMRTPRVYGFDTGFVRYYSGWAEPRPQDLGALWEHYVLNELQATVPYIRPRYWRTKSGQEVDFVVPVAGGEIAAIECKWKAFGSHDYAGLRAFRRAYPKGPTFVVGQDVTRRQQRTVDGIQVQFLPIGALGDAVAALAPRA